MRPELVTRLAAFVHSVVTPELQERSLRELCSLDAIEAVARALSRCVLEQVLEAWKKILERAALEVGRTCPGCGHERKCKTRPEHPMRLKLLGLELTVPKLYLECDQCEAPGVSITRLLTGLSSGDTSAELELAAAYCAAQHSYGKASRDLEVHYGRPVERTAVRRMALEVEHQALVFAQRQRKEALERISGERKTVGLAQLMLQGDGGTVRTGVLLPCERGDPGYGKKTLKRGGLRRKRPEQKRELITLDVRQPDESEPSALDVVVPITAAEGEREERMLALAARKGLDDNTQVIGLGDLGSRLPQAFDEAFVGYNAFYSGDWKHTCNYVENAGAVLEGIDPCRWKRKMKDALWKRNERVRDRLLAQAHDHRVAKLPEHLDRCPVQALDTYVHNNWKYLEAARLKEMGVDFVSARAEAQVRDRTKARFRVPGAWREENLEGKATLRAIIAEGSWLKFRAHYIEQAALRFDQQFQQRFEQAVAEGRIRPTHTGHGPKGQETSRLAA
jgi:hypothetical protein